MRHAPPARETFGLTGACVIAGCNAAANRAAIRCPVTGLPRTGMGKVGIGSVPGAMRVDVAPCPEGMVTADLASISYLKRIAPGEPRCTIAVSHRWRRSCGTFAPSATGNFGGWALNRHEPLDPVHDEIAGRSSRPVRTSAPVHASGCSARARQRSQQPETTAKGVEAFSDASSESMKFRCCEPALQEPARCPKKHPQETR